MFTIPKWVVIMYCFHHISTYTLVIAGNIIECELYLL